MKQDVMSRDEFTTRFAAELEAAATDAERGIGGRIARDYRIAFEDPGSKQLIDARRAADLLYDGTGLFPRVIDISIVRVADDHTVVFVRPSAHERTSWDATWNQPNGRGPFKRLLAERIKDDRDRRVR